MIYFSTPQGKITHASASFIPPEKSGVSSSLYIKNRDRKIRQRKLKTGRQHGLLLLGPILMTQKDSDCKEEEVSLEQEKKSTPAKLPDNLQVKYTTTDNKTIDSLKPYSSSHLKLAQNGAVTVCINLIMKDSAFGSVRASRFY